MIIRPLLDHLVRMPLDDVGLACRPHPTQVRVDENPRDRVALPFEFLTDTLARIDTGLYAAPSKLTVAEYLTREWLPAVRGTLRPLSVKKYEQIIRLHVVPRIGSTRLQALSAGQLNGLYADLGRDGLSVSTRRLVHAVIGRALRDAERWGRVPRNVARLADPPSRGTSGRPHGPPASCAGSSTKCRATGCSRSGAWPQRPECVAANSPG